MNPKTIPGYDYASPTIARSPVTLADLASLKVSVGLTSEDERYLQMAGSVLAGQTHQIVQHWRSGIIAGIPNLARHSQAPDGLPLPAYLAASSLRFEQWILDTCLLPYDQDWLNYQHEIALRHTSLRKNQTDHVQSTPYVPLRDILAFLAVMNQTIRPYLAAKNHTPEEVDRMHSAWCKSMQLQIALWAAPYSDAKLALNEW